MTEDPGATPSIERLLRVLDLDDSEARTTEDIFTGISHPMPTGRVYGGQVVAQSIVAAERTLPEGRHLHSMHGYFLRAGDASKGITFSVDRIHDGRSFATRRAQAYQNGLPIFSMIASFQDDDSGLEHAAPMPADIPAPEDLPAEDRFFSELGVGMKRLFSDRPVDIRHVEGPIYVEPDPLRRTGQAVWMRLSPGLPASARLHRAALAYLSDMTIQESVVRAHGLTWRQEGLKIASLDHAMWWHRDARVDDWLLYVQDSPNARGGRGLINGRFYTRDGVLVASTAQEIMIRVPRAEA